MRYLIMLIIACFIVGCDLPEPNKMTDSEFKNYYCKSIDGFVIKIDHSVVSNEWDAGYNIVVYFNDDTSAVFKGSKPVKIKNNAYNKFWYFKHSHSLYSVEY